MQPGRLSLRTKLAAFNVGMVVVTLAGLLGLDVAFQRVRINGPLYAQIERGQDVVADILPPPLYIVEGHLAVTELVLAQEHGDALRASQLETQLRRCEADFESHRRQWQQEMPAGPVRAALVESAAAPAATYFQIVERDLLPALRRGDGASARELLVHSLQPLFAEHRDRIEFTVAAARRENEAREAGAARMVQATRWAMLLAWLALACGAFVVVRRGLMKPVVQRVQEIGQVLDRIGAGDVATAVETGGDDEFAQILQAVDRMRSHLQMALATVEGQRGQLEVALLEARSGERAKSEFLANMSHEIRTPMNAVLGMTDLALRTALDERQRGYLAQIRTGAESLLAVLDDILDFARIEAGALALESREFALAEVLDRLQVLVGQKAARKGLALRLDVAPDVPAALVGDPRRLLQVLVNLCGNAVKFTERGEIVVTVQTDADADATDGTARLRFAVRDTGIGLSPGQIAGLFQPFAQVDASSTREHGGTGLGLAICRRLVAMMSGEIGVDSTHGRGSEFRFSARFGRVAGEDAPARAARVPPASAGTSAPAALRGRRVLLVEDNELNRLVATELLGEVAGMQVTHASDGQQALAALRAARFDLVLMDVQMPGIDGYRATALIREQPGLATLPVIAMTAHASAADREKSREAGMNDHVGKPFEPRQLFDVLVRWLPATVAPAPDPHDADEAVAEVDFERGRSRCLGRAELHEKILRRYVAQRAAGGDEIRAALDADDTDTARRVAHTLVSTAAMIGADRLSALARTLHDAIEAGDRAAWPVLADRLAATQASVDAAVMRHLSAA